MVGVELLDELWGLPDYRVQPNSEYHVLATADRLWGISFIVERGTTQIAC